MSKNDNSRIIAAVLRGLSLDEIAKAGGVSRSTAQRRLKEPEVVEAIREGRARLNGEMFGMLSELNRPAVERLHQLIADPDPRYAARGLALFFPARSGVAAVVDIEDRLADLEAMIAAQLESSKTEPTSTPQSEV